MQQYQQYQSICNPLFPAAHWSLSPPLLDGPLHVLQTCTMVISPLQAPSLYCHLSVLWTHSMGHNGPYTLNNAVVILYYVVLNCMNISIQRRSNISWWPSPIGGPWLWCHPNDPNGGVGFQIDRQEQTCLQWSASLAWLGYLDTTEWPCFVPCQSLFYIPQ